MVKKKSKKQVKPKNLIHIKLDYLEAKKGKTEMLSSQANLLKLLKIINNYKISRNEELTKKIEIAGKIKEIKSNINKLKLLLPTYQIPEILKREKEIVIETKSTKKVIPKYSKNNLDYQLEEIQRKLKILQEK